MARPPKPRWRDRTVRCGNGHEFTAKQKVVGSVVEEPGGSPTVIWTPENVEPIVACPVPGCPSTSFELVDE